MLLVAETISEPLRHHWYAIVTGAGPQVPGCTVRVFPTLVVPVMMGVAAVIAWQLMAESVTATAPGLFTANSSGKGPGAILNQDGSFNSGSNAAEVGSVVVLYGTGEGAVDPVVVDGAINASSLPTPREPMTVRIGGKEAEVLYGGAAPGLVAGVFQINVRIPEGVEPGNAPVVVMVGRATSSPEVTVAVR